MVISKSELLNGKKSFDTYELESCGEELALRPLTIGEIQQIEEMKSKALGDYVANQTGVSSKKRLKSKLEAQAKINVGKTTIADNKADVKIITLGLDNEGNPEKWTEEDVKQLDKDVFDELCGLVKKISHMEDENVEDDAEDFPEE